uniref:Uncharacterized protein n=1 Tax=Oryza sativa subsp. japonica TaxID=39947 RepID=Q6KAF0_ORYSJ|nr:hypothetical protein [Oryza sativa Japonica Group]
MVLAAIITIHYDLVNGLMASLSLRASGHLNLSKLTKNNKAGARVEAAAGECQAVDLGRRAREQVLLADAKRALKVARRLRFCGGGGHVSASRRRREARSGDGCSRSTASTSVKLTTPVSAPLTSSTTQTYPTRCARAYAMIATSELPAWHVATSSIDLHHKLPDEDLLARRARP